jgi:hypothetical protein
MRRPSLLLASCGLFVSFVGPAFPAHAPTPGDAAAIAAVFDADPACSTIAVSDRDSTYARWDFNAQACEPTANGFGIVHRDGAGHWRSIWQASEDSTACPVTPVPTAVGVELRACRPGSRHIYLRNFLNEHAAYKPAKLPHGAHSFIRNLRWRHWDKSIATAPGILDYVDRTSAFTAPLRMRASRVRYCGPRRFYTRLSLHFVRAADRRRLGFFEGALNLGCPDGITPQRAHA